MAASPNSHATGRHRRRWSSRTCTSTASTWPPTERSSPTTTWRSSTKPTLPRTSWRPPTVPRSTEAASGPCAGSPPESSRGRRNSTTSTNSPAASTMPSSHTSGNGSPLPRIPKSGHCSNWPTPGSRPSSRHCAPSPTTLRQRPRPGPSVASCPRTASSDRSVRSGVPATATSPGWKGPAAGPCCACHPSPSPTCWRSASGRSGRSYSPAPPCHPT